ncbi:asn/thr-rich large protein family protein, partial [Planoprotostelium fungivorum]
MRCGPSAVVSRGNQIIIESSTFDSCTTAGTTSFLSCPTAVYVSQSQFTNLVGTSPIIISSQMSLSYNRFDNNSNSESLLVGRNVVNTNNNFTRNRGDGVQGVVVRISQMNGTFQDTGSIYDGNAAINNGIGGAIYLKDCLSVDLHGVTITNNQAAYGAAIQAVHSVVHMTDTIINDNNCSRGQCFIIMTLDTTMNVETTHFQTNTAQGGVLMLTNASTIDQCHFDSNSIYNTSSAVIAFITLDEQMLMVNSSTFIHDSSYSIQSNSDAAIDSCSFT